MDYFMSTICTNTYIVIASIYTFIVGMLWIMVIYIACKIIGSYSKTSPTKTTKALQIMFIVTTALSLGYYPFFRWRSCMNEHRNNYLMDPVWNICCSVQVITLSLLFLRSVINVFYGTIYEISNCTLKIYGLIYIIGIITTIPIIILSFFPSDPMWTLWSLIAAFNIGLYIVLMISLTILFISKLVKIYKNTKDAVEDESNQELVGSITRLTLLISLSMIISLIVVIITGIRGFIQTETTRFIVHCSVVFDLYTNFVNTMLTQQLFDNEYNRICGYCDKRCRECMKGMVQNKESDDLILPPTELIAISSNTDVKSDAKLE